MVFRAIVALVGTNCAAAANPVCEGMEMLRDWVASDSAINEPPKLDMAALGLRGSECRQSLTLEGSRSGHCNWAFDYRSVQATVAFDALVRGVSGCFEDRAEVQSDLSVNHPDSYDLHRFRDAAGQVSVSIKDKGGLQKTFVFLRVDGLPPR